MLSDIEKPLAVTTYRTLIYKSGRRKSISLVRKVEAHILLYAQTELDGELGITLVVALAKCGEIKDARELLVKSHCNDVIAWTAVLTACVEYGQPAEALKLWPHMEDDGIEPNTYSFVALFKACAMSEDLDLGRNLHSRAHKKELVSDTFVRSALIDMYRKVGTISEAEEVFNEQFDYDPVTWTTMIAAYVEHGMVEKALHAYRQMFVEGIDVDPLTYFNALQACILLAEKEEPIEVNGQYIKSMALDIGRAIHADSRRDGYEHNRFLSATLLSMYAKCGAFAEAEAVLSAIGEYDLAVWRTMLSAYIDGGNEENALRLYSHMERTEKHSDPLLYTLAFEACTLLAEKEDSSLSGMVDRKIAALEIGNTIAEDAGTGSFLADTSVGTALITMYANCGVLGQAEASFCALLHRNTTSWTAMMSAYVEWEEAEKALRLYSLMKHELSCPDEFILALAFGACATLAEKETGCLLEGRFIKRKALEIGRALHAEAKLRCLASQDIIETAILSMYRKCGAIEEVSEFFSGISHPVVAQWNEILSAYVEYDQAAKAVDLYGQIQENKALRDSTTFIIGLQACQKFRSLEFCKQLHFEIVSSGYDQIPRVLASLLHTYGSCGSIADAQAIFEKMNEQECGVVQWNAYISAHAAIGNSNGALNAFEGMKLAHIPPNEETFLTVMSACIEAGFLTKGIQYFESMISEYNLSPNLQHYAIIFELLGRAGQLERIKKMIETLKIQIPVTIWLNLLASCQTQRNVELAKLAFKSAVEIQPELSDSYILMESIYAEAGMEECVIEVQKLRRKHCK
ncbi:hypothetical protein KP509_05G020600 [Ceratopteris richardii]|nr:hypothetical protein KP509_05G020600 [Ceratopteris richardii]